MEERIPIVGDIVEITRGSSAWNREGGMDHFIGQHFKIKEVAGRISSYYGRKYILEPKKGFEDVRDWSWFYDCGHFKLYKMRERKEVKLNFRYGENRSNTKDRR